MVIYKRHYYPLPSGPIGRDKVCIGYWGIGVKRYYGFALVSNDGNMDIQGVGCNGETSSTRSRLIAGGGSYLMAVNIGEKTAERISPAGGVDVFIVPDRF